MNVQYPQNTSVELCGGQEKRRKEVVGDGGDVR